MLFINENFYGEITMTANKNIAGTDGEALIVTLFNNYTF